MTACVPHAAAFGMRAVVCIGCGATFTPRPVHPGCEAAHCDGCRPEWEAAARADYLASREQAKEGEVAIDVGGLKSFSSMTPEERENDPRVRDPHTLTDADLAAVLADRYRVEPVPPCRVCGGALSISSMGGGKAPVWHCSYYSEEKMPDGRLIPKPDREFVDDHWRQSEWVQYRRGDDAVLELVRRFVQGRAT